MLFLLYLKFQKEKALWVIFCYCIYGFLNDISLLYLQGASPSSFLLNIFTILEFSFLACFFYFSIQNKWFKKILPYLVVGFVTYNIIYLIITPEPELASMSSVPATVEAFLLISISIFFFFEQISKPQAFFIYQVPSFWIVIAVLLYFSGAFFIFIYAENFTNTELNKYWVINYALNATKNILFAIAFLMKSNNDQNPTLTNRFPEHYTTRF